MSEMEEISMQKVGMREDSEKKTYEPYTSRELVLFLPRPQNRARKSLCNLRTLKPRRVDFTRQQQFLTFFLRGTIYV